MFHCHFCGGLSASGEPEKLVVTRWRLKTYEAKELPALPGTNSKRWSKAGVGYEAAEVKKSCGRCGVKSAPVPEKISTDKMVVRAV